MENTALSVWTRLAPSPVDSYIVCMGGNDLVFSTVYSSVSQIKELIITSLVVVDEQCLLSVNRHAAGGNTTVNHNEVD